MKNYIMATAVISLFVSTQIVPMDTKPSTKNLIEFENSLRLFLKPRRASFLSQGGDLKPRGLSQFKQDILYLVERYRIDYSMAKQIFADVVRNIVTQQNPDALGYIFNMRLEISTIAIFGT